LSLFIISLFLSNQCKILPLILSRLKTESCVSSAKTVNLMPISLLILVSIPLTCIKNNNGHKMEKCGTPCWINFSSNCFCWLSSIIPFPNPFIMSYSFLLRLLREIRNRILYIGGGLACCKTLNLKNQEF